MTDHKDKLLVPDNKEDLIPFTKKLKKVYGDKSKSITWLRKNGYSSLINRARKYYGKWSLFTLQADFLSENKSVHNQWTVKSISDTFDKLVDLHGEQKVNNTVWLRENGYGGMVKAIREIYGSFSEFQEDFGLRKTYTVNKWHKDMMIPYLNQLFEKHGKNG